MRTSGINHVSVHADDLDASVRFYVELLDAVPVDTPNFGLPVQWLTLGASQLHLFEREIAHEGLTRMHVVATMHERKALMYDLSDGFITLPGGLGTLDELLEITTWGQLGLHDKPIGLLDGNGFFSDLLRFLDHAVDQRFIRPEHRARLLHDRDPSSLLNRMREFTPPPRTPKWIEDE